MHLRANDIEINYVLEGPEGAPVVTFSHSLGSSMALWEAQASLLVERFQVLRYDNRGHGDTEITPAPYSFKQFAEDVYALLQALSITRTHFVGLSNGGMIAQTLALAHPEFTELDHFLNYTLNDPRIIFQKAKLASLRAIIETPTGLIEL